jgi:bacillithiol system protein YtxJ
MRPQAPIVLISVSASRPLSRHVAERFAIDHESPQVLVIRNNELVAARSHDDITVEFLLDFVDAAS